MVIKKLVFLVVMFLLGVMVVDASAKESIYVGDKIPNMYIRKVANDGRIVEKQGGFIRRTSDNKAVYCLEPFVDLIDGFVYNSYTSNYASVLDISVADWRRVSLIAYYGYLYEDHTEDYWYYITQMMIWEVVSPESRFYFTDTLGGENNPDLYAKEKAELNDLVNNHNITPDFPDVNLIKGEKIIIKDKAGVLSNYDVISDNAKITGNELTVVGEDIGIMQVAFKKESDNYDTVPIVYADAASQNILAAGKVEDVDFTIDINVTGVSVNIKKIDAITKDVINISGIKFAIYDEEKNLVFEGVTNSEGILETDAILGIGKYKIVEVEQEIPGYMINEEGIYFEIDGSSTSIDLEFPNYPITKDIKVIKYGSDNVFLENVTFGLYDESDNLIEIKKTNEFGEIIFSDLRLGNYHVKELETIDGYILDNTTYDITLEDDYVLKIINYEETGSINIIKTNADAEALAGAEFILYDQDMKKIEQVITDDTGRVKINDVKLGKYYLEEIKAPEGYKLLEDIIEFEILENGELITINIINEEDKKIEIEIEIPDTEISYKIDKFIFKKEKKKL